MWLRLRLRLLLLLLFFLRGALCKQFSKHGGRNRNTSCFFLSSATNKYNYYLLLFLIFRYSGMARITMMRDGSLSGIVFIVIGRWCEVVVSGVTVWWGWGGSSFFLVFSWAQIKCLASAIWKRKIGDPHAKESVVFCFLFYWN